MQSSVNIYSKSKWNISRAIPYLFKWLRYIVILIELMSQKHYNFVNLREHISLWLKFWRSLVIIYRHNLENENCCYAVINLCEIWSVMFSKIIVLHIQFVKNISNKFCWDIMFFLFSDSLKYKSVHFYELRKMQYAIIVLEKILNSSGGLLANWSCNVIICRANSFWWGDKNEHIV